MGIKKYIPGLKPKASTNNLVVPVNNGSYPGGYGGYNNTPSHQHQQQQHQTTKNNIYSIPEFGSTVAAATPNQPRTVSGDGAIPSFEASRSVSSGSGSGYSFSNNSSSLFGFGSSTHSLGSKTSITTTNTGVSSSPSTPRNFSGTSARSSSTTTAKLTPPEPQVTATDVRRCTKLLRQMFELHLELWALTYTHGTDQHRRQEKRMQVEAILVDIHHMVGTWHNMPPSTWTEEEYEEIKWIAQTLADLPPPRY